MDEAPPRIIEHCPSCGQPIDVTDQRPFARVACPACDAAMRARVQFGSFTLRALLGEGGMGSVYKALDQNLQREVALKVMKPDAGATDEDLARLATEARLTASVNHPSVVKVFSFGEDHGQFYLAMELVEKGSLDSLMEMQGKLAEIHALEVGIQAAEGLRAAFEVGLIHRDIKPGNILFAGPRQAKLVDFGLARIMTEEAVEAGEIWGTPFYVAPEKLDGRPEDFRSDIYSLGGTLFHAIAGRPPFDAKTASLVVVKHLKSQAVSLQAFAPSVSAETAAVINRMLHKEPDQRFGSYDELIRALQQARAAVQRRAAPVSSAGKSRGKTRSVRSVVAGAASVLPRGATIAKASWLAAGTVSVAALVAAAMLSGGRAAASGVDPVAAAFAAQGRAQLASGQPAEAGRQFRDALGLVAERQPEANWLRAQLGLAQWLADDPAAAETFAALDQSAVFRNDLVAQPLGRAFQRLARTMSPAGPASTPDPGSPGASAAATAPGPPPDGPFAHLALGLRAWRNGDIVEGGARLGRFADARLLPGDDWLRVYRPLVEPYLADYATYQQLREAVGRATPADSAAVIVRIEKAKAEARTGAPMVRQLDVLLTQLPL